MTNEQYNISRSSGFEWKCTGCRQNTPIPRHPGRSSFSGAGITDVIQLDDGNGSDRDTDRFSDFMLDVRNELRMVRLKQDELINSVSFCSDKISEFEKSLAQIANNTKSIEKIKASHDALKREVSVLSSKLNDTEQFSGLKNIELQGVPDKKDENLNSIFEMVTNSLGVDTTGKVEFIHRVQSFSRDAPKNIIVGLSSRPVRDRILEAAKAKRNAGASPGIRIEGLPNIFINEHLTSQNKLLFKEARDVAKAKQYKFVWVKNGNIFVRKNENGPVKLIRSKDDLAVL